MRIGSGNDAEAVKEQYKTSKGLDTRISFHEKYSTNRQGYGNWIVSNCAFSEGMRMLELGCGTGSLWMGRDDILGKIGKLVLTDLSEGMLTTARKNIGKKSNIVYQTADIQDLPFADKSFDAGIANSVLYHVPDLDSGIREIRRVLRNYVVFYCATLGEINFMEQLAEWFQLSGERFVPNHHFTMQNGEQKLRIAFSDIDARIYKDSLHVTELQDLVEYLCSLTSLQALNEIPIERIRDIVKEHAVNGAVDLPKEYGMFIARANAGK